MSVRFAFHTNKNEHKNKNKCVMHVCLYVISISLHTETDGQKTRHAVSMAPTDTKPSKDSTTSPTASGMWSISQTPPGTRVPALVEPEVATTTSSATPQAVSTANSGGASWTVGGSCTAQDTTDEREFSPAVPENSRAAVTTDEAPVLWRGAASEEEKRAQSWEVVVDMLHRLNENESDLANIDSKALCKMQEELQKVCQGITRFMKLSSTLVNDEGTCVN